MLSNTLEALRYMPPTERLKVYNGLAQMGQRFGMDPKQILLIADSVHRSIAHGGDFKGKKTGVALPYIAGETGDEFLRRFEEPVVKQLEMAKAAVQAAPTQNYYQAINQVEENLGVPRGTLIDPNTSMEVKKAATQLLQPTADQIREVVNAGEDIPAGTQRILDATPVKPKALSNFLNIASNNGIIKLASNPAARRLAAAVPIAGTFIGAGTVEANAASRDAEIAANPNDPTLQVNKTLDQVSGWGDRLSVAGMATAATGAGAIPGALMTAAGEGVSAVAGLSSLVLDGGRAIFKRFQDPDRNKDVDFTTM